MLACRLLAHPGVRHRSRSSKSPCWIFGINARSCRPTPALERTSARRAGRVSSTSMERAEAAQLETLGAACRISYIPKTFATSPRGFVRCLRANSHAATKSRRPGVDGRRVAPSASCYVGHLIQPRARQEALSTTSSVIHTIGAKNCSTGQAADSCVWSGPTLSAPGSGCGAPNSALHRT